jgi:hypothetical protein
MKTKHIILTLFIVTVILILGSFTAFADDLIKVSINDELITFDSEPFIENETTLVPMRKIFEALNTDVQWVNETRQIIATDESNCIILTIDSLEAQKNGTNINLLVAPKIVNDMTYVPVRFIAESLNADVTWDEASQTVVIKSKQTQEMPEQKFTDYVPYSTSSLETLAREVLNGNVVYFDGQYWATPEFANMIANEEVVYENDVSPDTEVIDRYKLSEDSYYFDE